MNSLKTYLLAFCLCFLAAFHVEAAFLKTSIQDFESEKKVDQLLLLMQKRLAIMHEVAKTKWNQHQAIEDKNREEKILLLLAQKASQYLLDDKWAASFFQLQMDAAKKIQERDFLLWEKQGIGAFEKPFSLQNDLRFYIDQINQEMIVLLKEIQADRENLTRFVLEQPLSSRSTDSIDPDIWDLAISLFKIHP